MHRIDTAGSLDGAFADGNASTGVRGTRIGADWLNDLQANIFGVLEEGGITASKGRAEDLADAIAAMVAGSVGTGDGGVPATRLLSVGGLVQGGGSLIADRSFTVPAASVAAVLAGISDTDAITPAALFGALSSGLGGGSFTFGPLIIKWGNHLGLFGEGARFTTFDPPFPNGCFAVAPTLLNNSGTASRDTWPQLIGQPTAEGFTTLVQRDDGSGDTADGIHFIAIGH